MRQEVKEIIRRGKKKRRENKENGLSFLCRGDHGMHSLEIQLENQKVDLHHDLASI